MVGAAAPRAGRVRFATGGDRAASRDAGDTAADDDDTARAAAAASVGVRDPRDPLARSAGCTRAPRTPVAASGGGGDRPWDSPTRVPIDWIVTSTGAWSEDAAWPAVPPRAGLLSLVVRSSLATDSEDGESFAAALVLGIADAGDREDEDDDDDDVVGVDDDDDDGCAAAADADDDDDDRGPTCSGRPVPGLSGAARARGRRPGDADDDKPILAALKLLPVPVPVPVPVLVLRAFAARALLARALALAADPCGAART
jgi:hypothetical protein